MRFTIDSYLPIILCEFLAFFLWLWCVELSERSERHIKTCFLRSHSLYRCSATHNIQPKSIQKNSSSIAFVMQIGNKPMSSVSLFLRPERLNWKSLRL